MEFLELWHVIASVLIFGINLTALKIRKKYLGKKEKTLIITKMCCSFLVFAMAFFVVIVGEGNYHKNIYAFTNVFLWTIIVTIDLVSVYKKNRTK